jgi:hypothetical protein
MPLEVVDRHWHVPSIQNPITYASALNGHRRFTLVFYWIDICLEGKQMSFPSTFPFLSPTFLEKDGGPPWPLIAEAESSQPDQAF